MMDPP